MRARFVVLAILITSITVTCAAQELDLFELTDFVDPRLRGVETDELKVKSLGSGYQFIRAVSGYIANYTSRTDPTGSDIGFVHVAGNLYSGVNQYNVKFTAMDSQNSPSASSRPRFRLTGQMARYSFSYLEDPETKSKDDEIADRYLITFSAEERDVCGTVASLPTDENLPRPGATVCKRHLDSELGIQADSSIFPGADTDFVAFTFGVRNTAEDGFIYRGTIGFRFLQKDFSKGRVSVSMDHSLERGNGSLHLGATRLGLGYSLSLGKRLSLNAVYQPSYVPKEPGSRINHEMALFIDTRLYARIIPRREKVAPR
jgi:hypothetical protein